MSAATEMKRREFLKAGAALGGGLLISLYVPEFVPAARAADYAAKPVALNAFVRISADESVTVISNHSEMGQGIYTSLPMLLNEELEADWARVRVESSPVEAVYNHTVFGMIDDGRQHDYKFRIRSFPKNGRDGAHDADCRCGASLECGSANLPRREGLRCPCGQRPPRFLWQPR